MGPEVIVKDLTSACVEFIAPKVAKGKHNANIMTWIFLFARNPDRKEDDRIFMIFSFPCWNVKGKANAVWESYHLLTFPKCSRFISDGCLSHFQTKHSGPVAGNVQKRTGPTNLA
jgi:hypothetical protein